MSSFRKCRYCVANLTRAHACTKAQVISICYPPWLVLVMPLPGRRKCCALYQKKWKIDIIHYSSKQYVVVCTAFSFRVWEELLVQAIIVAWFHKAGRWFERYIEIVSRKRSLTTYFQVFHLSRCKNILQQVLSCNALASMIHCADGPAQVFSDANALLKASLNHTKFIFLHFSFCRLKKCSSFMRLNDMRAVHTFKRSGLL